MQDDQFWKVYLWSSIAKSVAHIRTACRTRVGPGCQGQQLPLLLLIEPAKLHWVQVTVHHPVNMQAVHSVQYVEEG